MMEVFHRVFCNIFQNDFFIKFLLTTDFEMLYANYLIILGESRKNQLIKLEL